MASSKNNSLGLTCAVLALIVSGLAQAQTSQPTITIVSGNGNVVSPSSALGDPLVVLVRDASGVPLANAGVSWTIAAGSGVITSDPNHPNNFFSTDASGQSYAIFIGSQVFGSSFSQSTVRASIANASVDFTMTTVGLDTSGNMLGVDIKVLSPTLPITAPIVGQTGQTGTSPIQVQVQILGGFRSGQGLPNIGVRLEPANPTSGPTISCSGGTVFTDTSGLANCNLVFGGRVGTGAFTVKVGGVRNFENIPFQVTVGQPGMIRIQPGNNNLAGVPGSVLTLTAEVTDLAGNVLGDVPVVFEAVTPGTVTLSNVRSPSDSSGRVSATATLGNTAGPVQVRVRTATGNIQALFTLNVTIPITGLLRVSPDNLDAAINTAFAQPLIVQVNNGAQPVSGVTVQFAVTRGSATLGTATAVTNAQGQASTTVRAGSTVGPITVTATAAGFTQTFNLTARMAGPSITSASFANVVCFQNPACLPSTGVAPGSIVTISGSGLATGIQGSVSGSLFGFLPVQVANVQVQFGNVAAPIFNVSNINGQESVTVQVPFEVTPGTVPVTVRVGSGSTTVNVQVVPVSPGLFEIQMSDGRRRALLLRPDGTFVSLQNPARRGDIIRAYVTGLGAVSPTIGTDQSAFPGLEPSNAINVVAPVVIGVNNAGVRVVSSTYARNLIGVYEVAFEVPNDTPPGTDIPFAVAVVMGDNLVFGNPSSIPVQ